MNRTTSAFFAKVARRVSGLTPEMRRAILKTFDNLRTILPEATLVRYIKAGELDRLLNKALVDRAFLPMQKEIRATMEKGFNFSKRDLPKEGFIGGVDAVAFDTLSPDVITAIRNLETAALDRLKEDVRTTVRQVVERGLKEGRGVGSIARELRSTIGLAPNQSDAVANFRNALESGDRSALTRALRDKRFDKTLDRALGRNGTGLATEQIDRMVGAYQDRFVAFNANVNARSATVDAYKNGQALSWEKADEMGVIPDNYVLMKEWIGHDDGRERPEHLEMNGEIVRADEPFSNGQMIPGLGEFGCRCLPRYFLAQE